MGGVNELPNVSLEFKLSDGLTCATVAAIIGLMVDCASPEKEVGLVRTHRRAIVCASQGGQFYWRTNHMDKDRIKGSAKEIKGKVKEVAGKVLGDAKLASEGKAEQAAGKVQNTVGGIKDTLKGK